MPAVFISYSGLDRPIASDVKTALKQFGFEQVFLDFDKETGFDAGENWEKRLYEELSRCHAVILVVTPNWLTAKWCFAELTQARALGKVILPVLCKPIGERFVLPDIQSVDLLDWNADGLDKLERRLRAITNELARGFKLNPDRPPFPGIHAFEAEDAAIYFGRDDETRAVIERLDARRAQGGARFLVVIGASGSGKSSLLKAGVLPQLSRRRREWVVLPYIRPEKAPVEALAKSFAQKSGRADDWRGWHALLGSADAIDHVEKLLSDIRAGEARAATVLLPIDQFEEVFTVATSSERTTLLHLLASAVDSARDLPVMVIATGRSDVLDGLLEAGELAHLTETYALMPMPLDRVPRLVEGPAIVAGLNVEKGLAEAIARDVESPEALPLLAHALWLLYRRCTDKKLSMAEYCLLGDPEHHLNPIQNSVRLVADQAIGGLKPADAELAALRDAVVPHLVRVRLDDGKRVRQPALLSELPRESLRLIRALVEARLLSTRAAGETHGAARDGGEAIVEVSHEALFKAWPILDQWLSEENTFLSDIERIKSAHDVWVQALDAEKARALLGGLLLSRASDWLHKYPQRFLSRDMAALRAFIAISAEAEDAGKVRIAAQEARARLIERRILRGAIAAALVFAATALFAGWQYFSADRAKQAAVANESQALAALSRTAVNRGLGSDGAELALAAWPRDATDLRPQLQVTLQALAESLAVGLSVFEGITHEKFVNGVQFSRDESRILSWSEDGTLRLWDAATGAQIGPAMKQEGSVNGAQFSRDESRILSWSGDKTLRLWDAATGAQIGPAMKHDGSVHGAQFSRDESRILSWSGDNALRLWDAATGAQIGPAMKHKYEGSVYGAQFSRDESRILSWSEDKTLRLWDAATGAQIGPAMKHETPVAGAQFSRDENRILSWSYENTLRLWDAATGAEIGPPMKHEGLVNGARFSRDGSRILSWSRDGTLRLWDAATGAEIGPAMKHEGSVHGAQFSRDESRILSWSEDRTLRLWDAATGAEIGPAMKHEGSVHGAQFSRDESRILSWSEDKTLRLWDAATGAQIGPAMKHEGFVNGAQFSRDESRILSWSEDKTLRLWDAATGAQIGPAMKHETPVAGAQFSRDESRILSWSEDGTLRLWDAATGARIGPAMKHEESVAGAQFSRDESRILSWSEDRTLRLWDAATGAEIGPAMKHDGSVHGAQFSRDESRILSWSEDKTLRLWDAATGAEIGPAMNHEGFVNGAQFSRDESRILSWSEDKTLRLWDAATGARIGPAMKHEESVTGARFSRDGSRILSWSGDKTLRLWDAATGARIGPAMKHEESVNGAQFSRDESRILSWSEDKTLRLWDAATGAEIGPAMKHEGFVNGAQFSRDESRILSWSGDKTLRLWDAATGAEIGPATMKHEDAVNGAQFSRDESRILSWSGDGTLRLWDAATGAEIGPAMKHEGLVNGAQFNRDESRILSWSNDKTLRLWNAAWLGSNLFEIACNHTPQTHDLARLSERYGVRIADQICHAAQKIPVPDWSKVELAPR